MTQLRFQEFNKIYQDSVETVLAHWTPDMQTILAAHCHSWGPGLFDFKNYLQASSVRFYRAYCSFDHGTHTQRICDVGGFWGVFPLTLKRIGYEVSMTESLQYYGDSFNELFKCIVDNGITVFDYDPFAANSSLPERFDVVTVMAILEHYPHSLKTFMGNIRSLLQPDGRVYIEVPNIAYWPKRTALLFGRTPLADLTNIFQSEVPFIGHHHEFTIAELRDLIKLSGLSIVYEDYYNYTLVAPRLKTWLRFPITFLAFSVLKESRECLAVFCRLE